jgi:hypothetical protein
VLTPPYTPPQQRAASELAMRRTAESAVRVDESFLPLRCRTWQVRQGDVLIGQAGPESADETVSRERPLIDNNDY